VQLGLTQLLCQLFQRGATMFGVWVRLHLVPSLSSGTPDEHSCVDEFASALHGYSARVRLVLLADRECKGLRAGTVSLVAN